MLMDKNQKRFSRYSLFRDTMYEMPIRKWYLVTDWNVNNKSITFFDSKYQAIIKGAE